MTDSARLQQQEERRRDETPAHKINIQSLTASMASHKWLTITSLTPVDHRDKINEAYYHKVMLLHQFLLAIRQTSSKFFIFQQVAPARTALRQSAFLPITLPDIDCL